MPRCTRCDDPPELKEGGTWGQKYCPRCNQLHKRLGDRKVNDGWVATGEAYEPPVPPFELQSGVTELNPAFKTKVQNVTLVPRPDPIPRIELSKPCGFAYAPLLHFIWFGTPSSPHTFAPVVKWAATLSNKWAGICLWVDNACLKTLIPQMAHVYKFTTILSSPLGTKLVSSRVIFKEHHVPIYIVSIDDHLEILSDKPYIAPLIRAINFEREHDPPFRLVQVASDILRIIVLQYYGGAYFDFDVDPSLQCIWRKFPDPIMIPLVSGFLCHSKTATGFSENDIIFVDPTNKVAFDTLNKLLFQMAVAYKSERARELLLGERLTSTLREVKVTLHKYKCGMQVSGPTLVKLAHLVEQDAHRGNKIEYVKALDDDVATLCRLVSESVEAFTFKPFQDCVQSANKAAWANLAGCFSHETLTKPFYSWGDPGASACIKLIGNATTLQAAMRGYLTRKNVARIKFETAVARMLSHLADIDVSTSTRRELALSWLDDIIYDCGHIPSVGEVDSWIRDRWPD